MIIWSTYLSLSYFTKHYTLSVHPHCCKWQDFVLFINDWVVSHYMCMYIYLFVYIYIYIYIICVYLYICIYHIFLHSSVDSHLGCFRILAIVNHAAVNVEVQVYFQISVFFYSNIYWGVELLGHTVLLFLVFCDTSILFSIVVTPNCIPTHTVWGEARYLILLILLTKIALFLFHSMIWSLSLNMLDMCPPSQSSFLCLICILDEFEL